MFWAIKLKLFDVRINKYKKSFIFLQLSNHSNGFGFLFNLVSTLVVILKGPCHIMSAHFWRILIPLPPNVSIFTTYIMSALFGEFFTPPFPSSCWRNIWRIPNPFVASFFMSTLKFFGAMHSTVKKSVQKVKKNLQLKLLKINFSWSKS